ncbi:MAG: hypothetical protein RJA11_950 [Bacteroidota bacterium]
MIPFSFQSKYKLLLTLWLIISSSTEVLSQVNFFDSNDITYNISYYEELFGAKVHRIIWDFEAGMISPEYANAAVIVVFNSQKQHWISLRVNIDSHIKRVDFTDLEEMDNEDYKSRLKDERFAKWKENIISIPLKEAVKIIDKELVSSNHNYIVDSMVIPEFYHGDEGEMIGVKKGMFTREYEEQYWSDIRMKVGCQRSEGFGIKFPKNEHHGMLDTLVIQSVIHVQNPRCNSQYVNAIWWESDNESKYYASSSTYFEYIISHFESVKDYVGCGNVFFAKCKDGNTIGWYKFSADIPEGEYLDISPLSKVMNRIVGGDSDYDGFESYALIENKNTLSAYFFNKNEFFHFPKGYNLLSNNEYEAVIVKKGKKKYYYNYDDSYDNGNGTIELLDSR